jgi:hypothetical protein
MSIGMLWQAMGLSQGGALKALGKPLLLGMAGDGTYSFYVMN